MSDKINALNEIQNANRRKIEVSQSSMVSKLIIGFTVVIIFIIMVGIIFWKVVLPKIDESNEKHNKLSVDSQQNSVAVAQSAMSPQEGQQKVGVNRDGYNPNNVEINKAAPVRVAPVVRPDVSHAKIDEKTGPTPKEVADQRKYSAPLNDDTGNDTGSENGASAVTGAVSAIGAMKSVSAIPASGASNKTNDEYISKFDSASFATAKATALQNRDFILTQGENIPCILYNHIDTTLPGPVQCYTAYDVWSSTGKVKLIERHSQVSGMITSTVAIGNERVFALWNRLITPQGIDIPLGSPATDNLGATGVDGYVDNHWFKRYGNALLISAAEDAMSAAFEKQSENSTVTLSTTQNTAGSLANETLKQSLAIPPTITKNQGEIINIYVTRDIDFSSVYELEPSE